MGARTATVELGDAELITAVREGDLDAYGELFGRHVEAARRLSRQIAPASEVDDLVADAFAKVLAALQRGGGPDVAFRAYLLAAVRRLRVDRLRAAARLRPTDDLTPFDPGVPFRDTAVEGFESSAAAKAFASLPERWQTVLWHTEVEGQRPAQVAHLLGMSPNSVAALAYRAREGLRQAFLSMHAQDVDDDACRWTQAHLGAYVRNGLSRRDATRVREHLAGCRPCTAVYLELTDVNAELAGVLAPALLGGAAAAYVASGPAAQGTGLVLLDRLRDLITSQAPATASAGVAAVVLGGALLVTLDRDQPADPPQASPAVSQDRWDRAVRGAADPRKVRPPSSTREGPAAAGRRSAPPTDGPAAPATAPPAATPSGAPSVDSSPDDGGATPGPAPTPPAEQAPPAEGVDLSVSASTASRGPVTEVRVTVRGLDAGGSGTLTVAGRDVTVALSGDPRCAGPSLGSGRCDVRTPTATYRFTATAAPVGAPALVLTVRPDGARDPDASDNRVVVDLS